MADDKAVAANSEQPGDVVYRPISPLAVTGFALAVFYAGLIVVTTSIALARGQPFFLPPWVVLVPVAGAVISWAAQRQIRSAEGTRAGLGVARWGFWLCVLTGLGYSAYTMFTGFALSQQAHQFLTDKDGGFFPTLARGGEASAEKGFLLTLPASDRGKFVDNKVALQMAWDKPAPTGSKGKLSSFGDHEIVRALGKWGSDETEIVPLGVQKWLYEKNSYKVYRKYRFKFPDIVLDYLIPVASSEDPASGERRWFVIYPEMKFLDRERTELGEEVAEAVQQARYWLQANWVSRLKRGRDFDDRTKWESLAPENTRLLANTVNGILRGTDVSPLRELKLASRDSIYTRWKKLADGRLQIRADFFMRFAVNKEEYVAEGEVVLRSEKLFDLDDPPPTSKWEIVEVELTHLAVPRPPQ